MAFREGRLGPIGMVARMRQILMSWLWPKRSEISARKLHGSEPASSVLATIRVNIVLHGPGSPKQLLSSTFNIHLDFPVGPSSGVAYNLSSLDSPHGERLDNHAPAIVNGNNTQHSHSNLSHRFPRGSSDHNDEPSTTFHLRICTASGGK